MVVLGMILVVAALALLAIPMARVPGEARAAKEDLTEAKDALADGHLSRARELVASARDHVDTAQGRVNGFGSDAWDVVPMAGTAVEDARHLVDALDEATSVAEIGVDLYPVTAGPHATLFRHKQIDEATLQQVIEGGLRAAGHLAAAETALQEVQGTTPLVGTMLAARRDEAAAKVDPLAETVDDLAPMLERLPDAFGFDGERNYLIALLNPAELRYSGGATLKFAPLSFDQGKVDLGKSLQPTGDPTMVTPVSWRPVPFNRFHHPGRNLLTSATFAPSWSVSGEELLRAWGKVRHQREDGVIAVDVVALAQLLDVTGPIEVAGYGELTSANLVHTLIGNYDQYYPDPTVQDALSDELIPAFESKFFGGGDFVAKAESLASAADSRHFALYFRDRTVQEGFAALGLDGDLTEPQGDYIGAFTQNTNGSKVDYYQRRSIALHVELQTDGSARDAVEVVVDNDTPPYAVPEPDPQSWYFTRWAGLAMGVFVPRTAQLEHSSVLGEPADLHLRKFYDQAFVAPKMLLPPSSKGRFDMRYRVADAATIDDDGELTYRLAYDPQGTVRPQSVTVELQLPEGYTAKSLPSGWSADGRMVTFPIQELSTSQEWEIVGEPSD
ncbi:DUF4012 domain-containing protein [Nocardioides sp.]|uniref:DUF4012 domain-containing protein n=1 Tax=Nocardioides sp. TaxID=35761 RepID=UPI00263718A5|nr:DUF4012 domain-containing protein [Nocardioides sp.]MDI6910898.1 DUF4012 domain-containing protein [Nocardioides sp.]